MTPNPSLSPTHLIIPTPGPATWDVVAQWVAIGILIACTVAVILFVFNYLPKVKKIKPFYASIAAVSILGGVFAFLLPVAFNSGFGKDDDGRVLRQLILYTTGGVLGVITLGETHRKNNQEKEKNENDHIRQVHAERRSRYTKAVEQLANEKAAIRLGGVYTLVGLVDEWLADETLKSDERQKEGQVIVNNLCAYVRSPFSLAEYREILDSYEIPNHYEGDFLKDRSELYSEQEIRQTIFLEISNRISKEINPQNIPSPSWDHFSFFYSNSPIFYSLSDLKFRNAVFSGARFIGTAYFINVDFIGLSDFSGSRFENGASFFNTEFFGKVNFHYSS